MSDEEILAEAAPLSGMLAIAGADCWVHDQHGREQHLSLHAGADDGTVTEP